ncbi:MAG: GTP-binding protein, partial [Candidatus Hodarchaeota archaeon]
MIINTYLIRPSTGKVLSSSRYWPIDVADNEIEEFLSTRQEISEASGDEFEEIPLIIGENKYMASPVVADLLLVFAADKREDERAIQEKVRSGANSLRKEIVKNGIDSVIERYFELLEPSVITKLKIALVGEGGVGKTTTLHLLLGDTPPTQYVPTIALNLETVENIRFGNYSLVLWDFAGQERFRKLWRF